MVDTGYIDHRRPWAGWSVVRWSHPTAGAGFRPSVPVQFSGGKRRFSEWGGGRILGGRGSLRPSPRPPTPPPEPGGFFGQTSSPI